MNNVLLDLFNEAMSINPNILLFNKFVDLEEPREEPSIVSSKSKKRSRNNISSSDSSSDSLAKRNKLTKTKKPKNEKVNYVLCSYCHQIYNQNYINIHKRIHSGKKPHQCRHCDKAFTQPGNRDRHEKIHTCVKAYQCSFCPASFIQKGSCERHERTHTGEKPYMCRIGCSRRFIEIGTRNTHELTHTGVKPR